MTFLQSRAQADDEAFVAAQIENRISGIEAQ
jgi:hypothetical protein